jgi:hypothetical protein
MAKQETLTNSDGEVRELTENDFSKFAPFTELPADLQRVLNSPKQIVPDSNEVSSKQPAA